MHVIYNYSNQNDELDELQGHKVLSRMSGSMDCLMKEIIEIWLPSDDFSRDTGFFESFMVSSHQHASFRAIKQQWNEEQTIASIHECPS
jgi:hypothetical protein